MWICKILALVFLFFQSWPALAILVPLPCKDSPSDFSGTCRSVLRECKDIENTVPTLINESIDNKIALFTTTQKKDLDISKPEVRDSPDIAEFGCNILDGQVNCGTYAGVNFRDNRPVSPIPPPGAIALLIAEDGASFKSAASPLTADETSLKFDDPLGSRENSYLRGAYVAALKCYRTQVTNEISSDGGINVATSSACYSLAKDVIALTSEVESFGTNLKTGEEAFQRLCEKPEIDYCKNFDVNDVDNVEVVKNRIKSCYVDIARTTLDTGLYRFLATCEIYARAEKSFESAFISGTGALSSFRKRVATDVLGPCAKQAKTDCAPDSFFSSCVRGKISSCYQSRFQPFIEAFVSDRFPRNGACKNTAIADPGMTPNPATDRVLFQQSCQGADGLTLLSPTKAGQCCTGLTTVLPPPASCPQPLQSPGDVLAVSATYFKQVQNGLQAATKMSAGSDSFELPPLRPPLLPPQLPP